MTLYDGKEMTMTRDDGGPAFPSEGEGHGNPLYHSPGMSLRDWGAWQALPVALLNAPFVNPRDSWHGGPISRSAPAYKSAVAEWRSELAAEAYAIADAMLAARAKAEGSTP